MLVHVVHQLTGRRFLVDTGAAFSIFPHQSSASPSGPLLSPSGRNVLCRSERQLDLSFNDCCFRWTFLLAAIQFPILGIDFLQHFWLLVDPAAGTSSILSSQTASHSTHTAVANAACSLSSPTSTAAAVKVPPGSAVAISQVATCGTPSSFRQLLEQFPKVVNPSKTMPGTSHGLEHFIITVHQGCQFRPNFTDWMAKNRGQPRPSSLPWRGMASFNSPPVHGRPFST
jgi:hypothetical protein